MNRRFFFTLPLSIIVLFTTGCALYNPDSSSIQDGQGDKVSIVTSFYPVGYLVEQVGGDNVEVDIIVQPGVEPHDYELTTKDSLLISTADLVVYNGLGIDDWVVDAAQDIERSVRTISLSEASDSWVLALSEEGEHEDGHEEEHEHGLYDPHTWLSLPIMKQQAKRIARILGEVNPANALVYTQNAEAFGTKLDTLHAEFLGTVGSMTSCPLRTFITSHDAFSYFAHEYGLQMVAISGISPEEEPSAAAIAEVIEHVQEDEIPVIFFETLASPAIAQTIAKETGAKTAVLNPIEGLTQEQEKAGVDYMDIMRSNVQELTAALHCK